MTRNTNSESQKKSRQKWVENNYQFNLDLHNLYTKAYYLEHREAILEKKREYYQKKKAEKQATTLGNV